MEHVAFTMRLSPGCDEEYKKRHDEIWPELSKLLKENGFTDYSIFLDKQSNLLFGTFKITDKSVLNTLSENPLMRKWWKYMSDITESTADQLPVLTNLEEVFYLR